MILKVISTSTSSMALIYMCTFPCDDVKPGRWRGYSIWCYWSSEDDGNRARKINKVARSALFKAAFLQWLPQINKIERYLGIKGPMDPLVLLFIRF